VEGLNPIRAVLLEESRLEFHRRDERGDNVDHLAGERAEGGDVTPGISGKTVEKAGRELLRAGVDPDEDGIPLPPDRVVQSVGEVAHG
jgi:hypothetical protein